MLLTPIHLFICPLVAASALWLSCSTTYAAYVLTAYLGVLWLLEIILVYMSDGGLSLLAANIKKLCGW